MAFADLAFTNVAGDMVISFNLKVDGVNASDFSFERQYRHFGGVNLRIDNLNPNPTPITFANLGNGNYTVTIANGWATYASDNARYLTRLNAPGNIRATVFGDYPNALLGAGIASNQACIDCHGASGDAPGRLGQPSAHYSAPMSYDACVVCHTENFTYGNMMKVGHGIHNSYAMGGYKIRPTNAGAKTYKVTYPTYMENCSVCHSADTVVAGSTQTALEVANAMPVTGPNCFSCHGSMESFDFTASGTTFHNTYNINTPCGDCHTQGGIARATVADYHNGLLTGRGGVIWNGVDTSVTEGAKIEMEITGIVDDGVNLAVSWRATYDGVSVNPCNATLGPTAPLFHLGAGPPNANLSLLRTYAQGDDFILGMNANKPGQALAVTLTAANTTCTSNVATTTVPVDAVEADRGIVAIQGRPRVRHANPAITAPMQVRAFTPTREWVVGTGALPAVQRRPVVDSGECLKCHVGSMYQHGGNRIDNVDMCVMCHNPAAVEQDVRVGLGITPAVAYDGKVGETYEMKTMLHAIHSAGVTGAPYVLYRGNGIFAWAGDTSVLNGWPGTGQQTIAGTTVTRNHNFHAPTYPRALNACDACHTPGFDVLPDQSKAMALTVDAGEAPYINQKDDTLVGASAAACFSCHQSSNAFIDAAQKAHGYQFGWFPQEFPEGRQTIIDAVK